MSTSCYVLFTSLHSFTHHLSVSTFLSFLLVQPSECIDVYGDDDGAGDDDDDHGGSHDDGDDEL